MGILNVTPDSFYDGGSYMNVKSCLKCVNKMLKDGVDIVD
ncbi:MAG: dihydropteroate synthase, partial [Flavobacteriales bacterium]|nr:dihydropteroate synthase [Flavobacteriales bacterium]